MGVIDDFIEELNAIQGLAQTIKTNINIWRQGSHLYIGDLTTEQMRRLVQETHAFINELKSRAEDLEVPGQ
jgi:hypothetical protein